MEDKKIVIKIRGIILHEGKLLVVRHTIEKSFVALAGGHLEWGEDIKECLSREMIEKLGAKPEIGRLFYINNYTQSDGKQYIEFFFEIKNGIDYLDTEKLSRSHSHEIAEVLWVSPTDDIRILPKTLADDFKSGNIVSDQVRFIKG